jgi:signal peptidase II
MKRILLFLIPALATVGLDRYSKILAVEMLRNRPPQSFLNDLFRLVYAENTGAFLSLGSGMDEKLRYWVLAIIPVVVLLVIAWQALTSKNMPNMQTLAFGFILGGGLSNIYDRITIGKVVDFMNLGIGDLRTGIFNVADMAIMLGLFMMLPFLFRRQPGSEAPAVEAVSSDQLSDAALSDQNPEPEAPKREE